MKIYNAVAVSSTTTYKSLVVSALKNGIWISGRSTSTATAVITVEVNDMDEQEYNAACAIGVLRDPTPAQEAANTAGWQPYPVYYLSSGVLTTTGTIAQGAAGTFSVEVLRGPRRVRLSWVNATGSGAVTAYANPTE